MRVNMESSDHFVVEFETEEELRAEYENNISAGGLGLSTDARLPEFTPVRLTLKLEEHGEITVPAMVVRLMEGALALAIEANPEELYSALVAAPAGKEEPSERKELNAWEKVRALSRVEKLLLAPKADRSERGILIQDNDAQVIYSLLKNPRITLEEVARITRSPLLTSSIAELIVKTTQWSVSPDIRSGLVNNPRTPPLVALRLLPTLPEPEIRRIAKSGGVSQALKQAALKIVINYK
ncbi:MAG: PilZ domain-containing protein [Blastocatellia bacterium]|nr:PilZ domain-containing protein [Blastocatellia bacterium]